MKIREILKGLKLNYKVVKSVIEDRKNVGKIFTYDMVNEEGYIVDYSPATLAVNGISIAGVQIIQFGFLGYKPLFVYDDLYLDLSDNAKEFVKQHELGHYELHKESMISGSGRDINEEYEADEYSAKIVGKESAIEALEEMKKLLRIVSFSNSSKAVKEMDLRISNLKNK